MITIDLSKNITKILVTVSEINPITTGSTLTLVNTATNAETSYNLPNDSSQHPERYNLFELETTQFSGLTESRYAYTIKDSETNITEIGTAQVISGITTPQQDLVDNYVFIDSNDDNYIILD
jgi:hypothetical protein